MATSSSYHPTLVVLHWIMAIVVLLMIASGLIVRYSTLSLIHEFQLIQLHKSFGVSLLLLLLIRVACRMIHKTPSAIDLISDRERKAAHMGHLCLYLGLLISTLSGWILVSSSDLQIPTLLFGLIPWPNLPLLKGIESVNHFSHNTHFYSAICLLLLIFIHVSAVVKHYFMDHVNILERMTWNTISNFTLVQFTLMVMMIIIIIIPDKPQQAALSYKNTEVDHTKKISSSVLTNGDEYTYYVNPEKSNIRFFGRYNGQPFEGFFESWTAEILFNPDDLNSSHIHVYIETPSVRTGTKLYDDTLPEPDWLYVEKYPIAHFKSQKITKIEGSQYFAQGLFTLRGKTDNIGFSFKLSDLSKNPVTSTASLEIDRQAYGIGSSVDPDNEWVSRKITIKIKLLANRGEKQ